MPSTVAQRKYPQSQWARPPLDFFSTPTGDNLGIQCERCSLKLYPREVGCLCNGLELLYGAHDHQSFDGDHVTSSYRWPPDVTFTVHLS